MRLQKYIAASGVSSRRHAEEIIASGRVQVNNVVITEMGHQIDENYDEIRVDGKLIQLETAKHYIAYNKPVGEVTTNSDPEGRSTVMDKFRQYPVRLFPVGRLDYDSEGLLLLTNDGDLMNKLLHPSHEVNKTYLTTVSNQVTNEELNMLRNGVMIDNKITSPAKVVLLRYEKFSTVLLITIHEGRNRQVRKMIEAINHQVVHLKRVQFGPVTLGNLPSGKWRSLTNSEIQALKKSIK